MTHLSENEDSEAIFFMDPVTMKDICEYYPTMQDIKNKSCLLEEIRERRTEYKLHKNKLKFTEVVRELKQLSHTKINNIIPIQLKYVKSDELSENNKKRVKEWRHECYLQQKKEGTLSWFWWLWGYRV